MITIRVAVHSLCLLNFFPASAAADGNFRVLFFFRILFFGYHCRRVCGVRGSSSRLSIFAHVKKAAVPRPSSPRVGCLKALWAQLKHAPESRQRICCLPLDVDWWQTQRDQPRALKFRLCVGVACVCWSVKLVAWLFMEQLHTSIYWGFNGICNYSHMTTIDWA